MDSLVKQWHQHLADHAYKVGSTPIPGEGWLLWIDNAKFSYFSQKILTKWSKPNTLRHTGCNWINLVPPFTTLIGRSVATTNVSSSIKLKIDWTVGVGLLELEFDWHSRILTEDTLVIVITDWLLKKVWQSTFILICQYNFCKCLFSKVDSVKCEVIHPLSMKPLLKQTRPVCF